MGPGGIRWDNVVPGKFATQMKQMKQMKQISPSPFVTPPFKNIKGGLDNYVVPPYPTQSHPFPPLKKKGWDWVGKGGTGWDKVGQRSCPPLLPPPKGGARGKGKFASFASFAYLPVPPLLKILRGGNKGGTT